MLNKSILMGRLTAEPLLKQTPNGVSVATFSLAVNRNYKREETDFINIVAWRQTADFVSKHFSKGQLVVVEGSIQTRSYTDKQGNKRTVFEVVAEQVYFAESKNTEAKTAVPESPAHGSSFSIGEMGDYEEILMDDGDLPF